MKTPAITLELSNDEAFVLSEWLYQFDQAGVDVFRNRAEEKVVWRIEGVLDERVVELFDSNYEQLLAEAQRRIENNKVMVMKTPTVSFELSSDEALVLLEWVAQFKKPGVEVFRSSAEEIVVRKIEGVLKAT